MKPLTPLVMELHPSSSSSICFQTYIYGSKTLKQISFGIFFATLHGKGAVDCLGGTVKHSGWRSVKVGGNAPLDKMSYSEIAHQRNPNINIFFILSEDIEKKSDEIKHWNQILPVSNTVKLHCVKTQGPDSVSNVSNGEAFSIIRILPATDERP